MLEQLASTQYLTLEPGAITMINSEVSARDYVATPKRMREFYQVIQAEIKLGPFLGLPLEEIVGRFLEAHANRTAA